MPRKFTRDREAVYDTQIAPLMAQIIDICQREDIPLVFSFQLTDGDDPLFCSSALLSEWADNMLWEQRQVIGKVTQIGVGGTPVDPKDK